MVEKEPISTTTTFKEQEVQFSFFSEEKRSGRGREEAITRQFYISVASEALETNFRDSPFFKIVLEPHPTVFGQFFRSSTIGPLPVGDSDLLWHICGLIDHYVNYIEGRR